MIFNQATGDPVTDQDFVTGGKRSDLFLEQLDNKQIGAKQWVNKWSNNN